MLVKIDLYRWIKPPADLLGFYHKNPLWWQFPNSGPQSGTGSAATMMLTCQNGPKISEKCFQHPLESIPKSKRGWHHGSRGVPNNDCWLSSPFFLSNSSSCFNNKTSFLVVFSLIDLFRGQPISYNSVRVLSPPITAEMGSTTQAPGIRSVKRNWWSLVWSFWDF